jgi:hypothetical protein
MPPERGSFDGKALFRIDVGPLDRLQAAWNGPDYQPDTGRNIAIVLKGEGTGGAALPVDFFRPTANFVELVFPSVAGNRYVIYHSRDPDGAPPPVTWVPVHEFVATSTKPDFKATLSGVAAFRSSLFYVECIEGAAAPLLVSSVTVNGGDRQRSQLQQVSVTFNRDTNVPDLFASGAIRDAFRVFKLDTGFPEIGGPATPLSYDPASRRLTADFRSVSISAAHNFLLRIDTAAIHAAGDPDNKLRDTDGTADGFFRFGHRPEHNFFRLAGDMDGDRSVSGIDVGLFTEGAISGAPDGSGHDLGGLGPDGDLGITNGDGRVDGSDIRLFVLQMGNSIAPHPGPFP